MRAIKSKLIKDRLLSGLLILGVLFLLSNVFLHFHHAKNVELEPYDVTLICESVPAPVFSVPEGIYGQPFELEIQAPEGYDIFYTTDGSIPTVYSNRYKKPMMVDPRKNINRKILTIPTSFLWRAPYGKQNHCVVFRARCFRNGAGYGKVVNVIYSTPKIRQHQDFQIVHILMDADSLFSPQRGIYIPGEKYYSKKALVALEKFPEKGLNYHPANYYQRGKRWARPATFILMNVSGETFFEQNIILNVRGVVSRILPEKSLRITADNQNDTVIRYSFFNELPYSSYKRLILRNSGSDIRSTMFRDALIHRLANGTKVDVQAYTPSVVYINGNYWGIHNIHENQDEHYLAAKYASSLQDISILYKVDYVPLAVKYGQESSLKSFEELLNFILENSLANHETYHAVCAQIDVDNFIDYMILQTFFANWDWPNNNVKIFRLDRQTELMSQQGIDAGKWRWFFFDLDGGMEFEPSVNMYERLRDEFDQQIVTQIFRKFMENKEFKDQFITRYEYLVKNQLTSEKMLEQINLFEQRYRPEIERQISRWRLLKSTQYWQQEVEFLRNFVKERPEIVLKQLEAL